MISEVGGKILDSFADCLSGKLATKAEPEKPEERPPLKAVKPVAEGEAIDLMEYAGESVVKRVAPVLVVLAGVLLIVAIVRAVTQRAK